MRNIKHVVHMSYVSWTTVVSEIQFFFYVLTLFTWTFVIKMSFNSHLFKKVISLLKFDDITMAYLLHLSNEEILARVLSVHEEMNSFPLCKDTEWKCLKGYMQHYLVK